MPETTKAPAPFIPRSARRLELAGKYRPLFEKIYAGKGAMIECIEGQCLDCMGFVRQDVADCGDKLCPLHRWRPYQKAVQTPAENSGAPEETQ